MTYKFTHQILNTLIQSKVQIFPYFRLSLFCVPWTHSNSHTNTHTHWIYWTKSTDQTEKINSNLCIHTYIVRICFKIEQFRWNSFEHSNLFNFFFEIHFRMQSIWLFFASRDFVCNGENFRFIVVVEVMFEIPFISIIVSGCFFFRCKQKSYTNCFRQTVLISAENPIFNDRKYSKSISSERVCKIKQK